MLVLVMLLVLLLLLLLLIMAVVSSFQSQKGTSNLGDGAQFRHVVR